MLRILRVGPRCNHMYPFEGEKEGERTQTHREDTDTEEEKTM